ncbi:MAG: hypothetical protein CMP21_04100 [Rickettsiales bacterium]|nr:hypothetical protein [Rickettsiales bacterium]|tara:strand:+ start:17813 stop:19585 length:1773 start_codon:yes stop_codon:yes gene_type:complete
MGTQITPTGIKFPNNDTEQTKPVVSVNSTAPDDSGNIEVAAGGGATYTSQDYHASTDFLFKDSKWYGGHLVYSYSTNASAIENLSVGSVLHEVSSGLPFSVVSIDAAANQITLNRGDFTDLNTSNRVLEDRENSTFGGTTFTYISGANNSLNCTNIWLQVKGNENHANTTTLPTTNNSVANLPMKLDHLPSMATHIIFRVSSETGGSFKIYNRETFNTRPADAELLPSEIVHQIDIEGSGTQSGFSEFRVPINSYFRFWVTGGAKANLYPVGYSVLDLSEIDLESASNPVIDAIETRVTTLETNDVVTTVNGQTGDVTVSTFDGNYNSLDNKPSLFDGDYDSLSNKPTIPTDINQLDDDSQLLSSGGGGGAYSFYRLITGSSEFTNMKTDGSNILRAGIKYRISLIGAGGGSWREGNYSYMLHTAGGGGGSINFYYTPSVDTSYEVSIGNAGSTYNYADINKETSIVFSDGSEARAHGGENGSSTKRLYNGGSYSYIANSSSFEFIDGAIGGKGWYYDDGSTPARANPNSGFGGDDSLGPSSKAYTGYTASGAGGMSGRSLEFVERRGNGSGGGYDNGSDGAILIQWSIE